MIPDEIAVLLAGSIEARVKIGGTPMRCHDAYVRRQMRVQSEREFLNGYFTHEPVAQAAVRLYECLAILEKWLSVLNGNFGLHRWRDIGKRCVAAAWDRHLTRTISELLDEIDKP